MREKLSRPGWVWVIATWYFGWSALVVVFACLVYTGAIHLTASHRSSFDSVVSHISIANIVVWVMLLTGAALLFRLSKSAYYFFVGVFAGNSLLTAWYLTMDGWEGGRQIVKLAFSLGVPLILFVYSKHLAAKGVLT
jgi:hypothetical protein